MPYTVTIYIAAPGTPLLKDGKLTGETSAAGHMWYSTNDGREEKSFGFAPAEHGSIKGPGKLVPDDVQMYKDPRYARTMEISKAQFDSLQDFGLNAGQRGFDMGFNGAKNACIDFTWTALNRAGLHTNILLWPDKNFEGDIKPLNNVAFVRAIRPPFPDSPLNQEKMHKLPERSFLQWYISEHENPTPQQTIAAAETQIPPRLQPIVNDLKTHINDDLQQAGCTPAQITNACVAVASTVATLRINDKSIEMAFLDENKTISVYAGGIGREMPLNQAVNQPIAESVAQMNQTLEQQQQEQLLARQMSRGGPSMG